MATQFSQLPQSERSRYRLEVSNRRLRRAGIAPAVIDATDTAMAIIADSIAVPERLPALPVLPVFQADSEADKVAVAVVRDAIACELKPLPKRAGKKPVAKDSAESFIIEYYDAKTAKWRRVGKHCADRARDMATLAGDYAKFRPGTKVRVIKAGTDRATLRFCYQADKVTGAMYLGSYR